MPEKENTDSLSILYCRVCEQDTLHCLVQPERLSFGLVVGSIEGKLFCAECNTE